MSAAGIIGLGLIGGSIAHDLAAAGWRVQGTDRDPATEAAARRAGVIRGGVDLASVEVVVLAVPVGAAPSWLRHLGDQVPPESRLVVTDVGSTKRAAVAAAEQDGLGARFIGSHPIAGDHRSGWAAARPGLFRRARVWLCPASGSEPEAIQRVESMWRAVGARPRRIDPLEHDRLMARISHLPQVAGTALALALERSGIARAELGPGGRDAVRLAGSDPVMWRDILVDNGDQIGPALDTLIDALVELRNAVGAEDRETIRRRFETACAWAATAGGAA